MDQRISLITLGVADLARARDFYERGLGWAPLSETEGVCFYQLPGIVLALFVKDDLEKDARRAIDGGFSGMTIAINGRDRAEVDAIFDQALAAGATELKRPDAVFWGGYSGYFADLDGHVWEVAHNPAATITEDGRTLFSAT